MNISYTPIINYIGIGFRPSQTVDLTFKIQLEEGNEATEYEIYKESITAIPLPHNMRSLPNGARDRIDWQDGKWYDKQCIARLLLDGVNVKFTQKSSSVNNIVWMTGANYDVANYIPLLCSHGQYLNSDIAFNEDVLGAYFENKRFKLAFGANTAINTLELANEWLLDNNVEVIYELAEPIVTEITDPAMIEALEHIRTFAGITNIVSDANAKLTYYTNTVLNDEYETKLNAGKKYNETIEKFAQQSITNEGIISSVSEIKSTMQEDYQTKEEASTQYAQLSREFEFKVNNTVNDLKNNGVPKVVSSIITIDNEGLKAGRSDSEYYNLMNNVGNYQYNAGKLLAQYDKDGAEIPRLKSDVGVIAGLKHTKEKIGGIVYHRTYVIE